MIDASRKRIAVLCGLGDGGMEIALVRLLQDLDYNQVSVTLLTAERQGPLLNMLPDQVAVRHCHFTSAFAYAIGVNDFSDCGTIRRSLYPPRAQAPNHRQQRQTQSGVRLRFFPHR